MATSVKQTRLKTQNGSQTDFPPPLQSGDRLTRREFERRYEAMPDVRAELIEGVVFMASPLLYPHAKYHSFAQHWLGSYVYGTPYMEMVDNVSLRVDADNEIQPDICVWLDVQAGGKTSTTPDGYVEGAPELIVEIAASSAGYDLHDKKRVYRRNGVLEYVVFSVYEQEIYWYVLEDGDYRMAQPDENGIWHCRVFPGLWLAGAAFWERDGAKLVEVVQKGMQTEEYKMFCRQLTPD